MKKLWNVLEGLAAAYLLLVLIHLRSLEIQKRTTEDFARSHIEQLFADSADSEKADLVQLLVDYDKVQRLSSFLLTDVAEAEEELLQLDRKLISLGCDSVHEEKLQVPLPEELPDWRTLVRSSGLSETQALIAFVSSKQAAALTLHSELAKRYRLILVQLHRKQGILLSILEGGKCL